MNETRQALDLSNTDGTILDAQWIDNIKNRCDLHMGERLGKGQMLHSNFDFMLSAMVGVFFKVPRIQYRF